MLMILLWLSFSRVSEITSTDSISTVHPVQVATNQRMAQPFKLVRVSPPASTHQAEPARETRLSDESMLILKMGLIALTLIARVPMTGD